MLVGGLPIRAFTKKRVAVLAMGRGLEGVMRDGAEGRDRDDPHGRQERSTVTETTATETAAVADVAGENQSRSSIDERVEELERDLARTRANVVAAIVNHFLRPRWWVELILIAGLYAAYSAIRNGVGEVTGRAFSNAYDILHFEDSFGIAFERALNHFVHNTPPVADVSSLIYASLHFIVTPGVLIWLFIAHRNRYRVLSSVLIVTTLLALIGFYWFPTAPPRMLGGEGFYDIMSETSSWGWWPASGAPGSDAISNQFAAMPSLHCAWATWCGLVLAFTARRVWVRALGILYPLVTYFVVMGTANHYFLDVLAGLFTLFVGAVITFGARLLWHQYVAWSWERAVSAS